MSAVNRDLKINHPYSVSYVLCGAGIRLIGDASDPLAAAAWTIEALFPVRFAHVLPLPTFQIGIHSQPEPDVDGETVMAVPGFLAVRTGTGYHLRSGTSWLAVNIREGFASGSLSSCFLTAPLEDRRGLFLMAFLLLFAGSGRYALHASAVAIGGHGVLLAGASGSGKTTVACALIRAGWDYLSDDAILLDQCSGVTRVSALSGPFHLTPNALRHFPELLVGAFTPPSGGKQLIDMSTAWPGRFIREVEPTAILFPEITRAESSRLIPLRPTEVCLGLLATGAGLLADRESMAGQTAIIAELSRSTPGYRLLHGADAHRFPETLADLIGLTLGEKPAGRTHEYANQF
jgi:hypothetical protein